jgi:hypothetical protein
MSKKVEFISFEFYIYRNKNDTCEVTFTNNKDEDQVSYSCSCSSFNSRRYCAHLVNILAKVPNRKAQEKPVSTNPEYVDTVRGWLEHSELLEVIEDMGSLMNKLNNLNKSLKSNAELNKLKARLADIPNPINLSRHKL